MRTSLGFVLLSSLVVGCATTASTSNTPASPCAKDLMDRGYVSGRGVRESAEAYCTRYTPGEIAIAKDLYDKKYEPRFAEGLTTAQAYTPAQIACAKKQRDSGKMSTFGVPDTCVDATFRDGDDSALPTGSGVTTAPAAGTLAETAVADAKTHSLYDVLAADKRFSKFLQLADFVGLSKSLKTGGPWTVMAPTNAAIARYPGGFDALKAKPDRLKTILTLHLVDAARPSSDLRLPDKKGATGKKWPTAQGRNLTLTEKGGRIMINDDVRVTKTDIPADNGLIYIVDELIKP